MCLSNETMALAACASPLRRRAATASAEQTGGGAVKNKKSPAMLPSFLRSFGGQFAILCAASLGIVPFLGLAVVSLLGDDEPAAPVAPSMVRTIAMPTPRFDGPLGGGAAPDLQLHGLFDGLQRQFERQERMRQSSDAAAEARMQRLEDTLATDRAAAATRQVAPGASDGERPSARASSVPTQESVELAPDLGVDWAAWSAGATIDGAATSWGLGREPSASGLLARAARAVASVAPRYRTHIGAISHPPDIVLATDSLAPSKCFTFEGNGSVAMHLLGARRLTHVLIEHVPAWADVHPQAAPRFFTVRATEPYDASVGDFEYALDGPRAQVFALPSGLGEVQAVKFEFGENWGAAHTSVCRLRVMGPRDSA